MTQYADRYWTSRDGLKLHYRDYPGREDRPPIICMHALTRNARDFENLASRLAGEWRIICPEMRGRGESDYARDAATYNPLQYVEDMGALFEEAEIDRFIAIGSSLGGIMAFIIGMTEPERIVAAAFNDIGPYIEPAGLERVKAHVGQGRNFPTWMHAARDLEGVHGTFFPDYELVDWLAMAKRLMTLSSNGRIVFDYDMKIAEPFLDMDVHAQTDLWPGLDALAGKPLLFIHGELSDLLTTEILGKMKQRARNAEAVTLPRVGHTPTLDEPEAVTAIGRLLAKVA